ncbi:hypothetical protein M8C21_018790 [Ambrosia artemisiifolia]|uniref:25S rRNA (uridine-N(3))-methyltransferase BMT5-like domain-containing protein n=1 Tax=Ambrosia artemisiifolia TaxID=4212 RepID=A0AAD5D9U0_AMBAR|nr:hypothetical protein M8C21_018790 [Ambrosia artemisiifolia]
MTCTSLNTKDELKTMYKYALNHICCLVKLGAKVVLGVDVRTMLDDARINHQQYDVIVFNQPYTGVFGKDCNVEVIKENKALINDFLAYSSKMLNDVKGVIHLSTKSGEPYDLLDVRGLANKNGLVVRKEMKFPLKDYPFYINKRGFGPRADDTYPLQPSSTFVLGIRGSSAALRQ